MASGIAAQPTLFEAAGTASRTGEHLTPKRPRVETAGLADVFPYYAGFSYEWARSQLANTDTDNPVVLDPWNGSGTTTLAAQSLGFTAIGADLNPVANSVAALRSTSWHGITPLTPPPASRANFPDDALNSWFSRKTTRRFREWATSLDCLDRDKANFGLISLFRVARALTSSFEGSNPTWVRRSRNQEELISIPMQELDELIRMDQLALARRLDRDATPSLTKPGLVTADSSALPIVDESIDRILTSPPYLTRIDYAVAYSRELALLGIDISTDRSLRQSLMGTTLIRKSVPVPLVLGPIAQGLVHDIASHSSKASSGYYLKQAVQYLGDLSRSFAEMHRVTRTGASITLVVQDSFYKDLHVRLADICEEFGLSHGWSKASQSQFEVKRTLTALNRAAQAYKKGTVHETAITFVKE